jgi:hypothetical protein
MKSAYYVSAWFARDIIAGFVQEHLVNEAAGLAWLRGSAGAFGRLWAFSDT